jgi:Ca2+-transporting ATPase
MTGESHSRSKQSGHLMLAHTTVESGQGKMLVCMTGINTVWGKILAKMDEIEEEKTPLQEDLESTVVILTKLGLLFGVVTFFVLAIYWAVDTATVVYETAWMGNYIDGLIDALIIGIVLLVIGIPEGLPLAVIVSLAYSMSAMTRDNLLVRRLAACETMGGVTNILCDKTGTLTENRMTVSAAFVAGVQLEQRASVCERTWEMFRQSIFLNCMSFRQDGKVVGSATEIALLDFVSPCPESVRALQKAIVFVVPFSSGEKRMISIYRLDTCLRIFVKGAPNVVFAACSNQLTFDGLVEPFRRQEYVEMLRSFGCRGLRVLAVAFCDVPLNTPHEEALKVAGHSLILHALIGLSDPVRVEVPAAVAACIAAGITMRVVTGDDPLTATHVAVQCGIKTRTGRVVEGQEFRAMSDEQLDRVLPQLQVLARAVPEDKFRLVQRLKSLNQLVAVTGDGANDAYALKAADVGLAMGVQGSDMAKESSDVILLDDNFKSIVSAVKWGRNVFESIQKFLQFQVTVSLVVLLLVFVGAVSRRGAPLKPVQMLWINLIQDTMAALALATEPARDELLLQKPHGRTERIITNMMYKHIGGQTAFQVGILLAIYFASYNISWSGGKIATDSLALGTLVFNTFVFAQVANEINCRVVDDRLNCFSRIHKSPLLIIVVLLTCGLQVIIVEFGGLAFQVAPLSWDQWLFCIAVGLSSLPFGFLLRALPVPKRHVVDSFRGWLGRPEERRVLLRTEEAFSDDEFHFFESVQM